jgi:hypothetical protein
MLGAVLAFVQPAPASPLLTMGVDATVDRPELRLADLIDLTVLPAPLRKLASELVLARFPSRDRRFAVRDSDILARARARVPALASWLPPSSGRLIRISVKARTPEAGRVAADKDPVCIRALRPIAVGIVPSREDFDAAPCEPESPRTFRYVSGAGAVRAVRPIAEGEVVGAWPDFGGERIAVGQRLTLKAFTGPVHVEREVVATQSALPGQHVFVQNSDGVVQSIRYEVAR